MKEKLIEARRHLAAIPNDQWMVGANGIYGGRCCAAGHLGCAYGIPDDKERHLTVLRVAVRDAFARHLNMSIVRVNDRVTAQFQQPTPKARILAALDECIAAEP